MPLLLLFSLIVAMPIHADYLPALVVPADNQSFNSFSVLSQEDWEGLEQSTVGEVLRSQVGLDVVNSGGMGQPTAVFIRGAKAEHTLVLLDGFELNDPSTTARSFDFSTINLNQVERIEVYRGAQTVRFGPDALGGVINIVTKKASGPLEGSAQVTVGSYQTRGLAGWTAAKKGLWSTTLSASGINQEGFSAADAGKEAERDGFARTNLAARVGRSFSSGAELDLFVTQTYARTELDQGGGFSGDDPDFESTANLSMIGSRFRVEGRGWQNSFQVYTTEHRRSYRNPPDKESFLSRAWRGENLTDIKINSVYSMRGLIQWSSEQAGKEQNDLGEALLMAATFRRFRVETGLRSDQFDGASKTNAITSQTSFTLDLLPHSTQVFLNYGEGIKTPSLFQLYSSFGSETLEPEKARSLDFGFTQILGSSSQLVLTLFQNNYRNLIEYDEQNLRFGNVSRARSKGLEASFITSWTGGLITKLSATRMESIDESTGLKLLRRPGTSQSAELSWRRDRLNVSVTYFRRGARDDLDAESFQRIQLPAYDVTSIRGSLDLGSKWTAQLRVENIFDRSFEEVAGFKTSRRAYYGDLVFQF